MTGISNWTLARRSVAFFFRSHLGTILGAAIATAVLTGALLVGDSVRGSLRSMALARLGKIDAALASGDRLFRSELAQDLKTEAGANANGNANVVAALQVLGSANTPDGSARANQVQVIGVDERFWSMANKSPGALNSGSVFINDRLANQLKSRAGDTVLLRVPRVSQLSRDAPLAAEEDATTALRLEVAKVLTDEEFGRFGLAASQIPPLNAFVPLSLLQARVNATNRANLLLVSGVSEKKAQVALRRTFQVADMQLQLRPVTNPAAVELRSPRVFLDSVVSEAAVKAGANPQPIFTYFVNQLQLRDRATPYSMVAGTTLLSLAENEIAINQWLADDLQAKPGDEILVTYYIMGLMRELIERTNTFRVREIVPMELPYTDRGLMPDFPGMTDAENCRDWDTGFPIKTDAIRDQDEAYWDQYKGAPKAFISLATAQKLWKNRFGDLTAVRFPGANVDAIAASIKANLKPEELGLAFIPVRQQALAASSGAQDFGGLFIGFSLFIIAAALLLMLLLFRFALEQRGAEVGTLLAIGFPPKHVSRLFILEGFGLAVIGSIIGVGFAVLYAKAMLYGLSTIWSDAVAGASLTYHGSPSTLAIGFVAGILVAVATIWWSLRREAKRSARELLNAVLETETGAAKKPGAAFWICGSVLLALGLSLAGWGLIEREQARPDLFFGAGALILIAGLVLTSAFIRRLEFSALSEGLSLSAMGVRSITRRRKRSRAAVALLACGSFLIASIGAFRLDAGNKAQARSSGTGGFALLGESSISIPQNLNSLAGRDFFGLSQADLEGVQFVPLRVLEGEDASCLNLNRAQRPRLLGVNSREMVERGAFTFSKTLDLSGSTRLPRSSDVSTATDEKSSAGASRYQSETSPWNFLDLDYGPDIVPAIGDAASIQWALGKKIGDDLVYLDSAGREFKVRIVGAVANSILQGNLLISEKHFIERFKQDGYRMFLIDAPSDKAERIAETLSKALQDYGFSAVRTQERLAAFNAVQNTYLGTFQMLGGLGLLLGSFGLGVILLRNIYERRSEFALLLAVGFRKSALRWLILSEHAALLVLGLFIGVLAAAIAVLPSVFRPGTELPYGQLALTLGAVFIFGLVCTLLAAERALRLPLLTALRNE